jgi:hypothetical protein
MKKNRNQLLILITFLLISQVAQSDSAFSRYFSTGFLYYEQNSDEEGLFKTYAIPLMVSGYYQRYSGSLTTSYLKENGDSFSLGDTTLSLGYDISNASGFTVILKEKFATGNEEKGLSTGKNDTSLQLDYATALTNRTSLIASIGYTFVGKKDKTPLGQGKKKGGQQGANDVQNRHYSSLGLAYALSNRNTLGTLLDIQESLYKNQGKQTNLSLLMSHALSNTHSLTILYAHDNSQTNHIGLTFTSQF